MAKSKSFLGDINIHNFKLGTKDVKLYLGDNLVYPTSTSLADAVVTCGSATYNAQTQIAEEITVVLSGNTLMKDVDYNVTQNSGGINVGNYTVEITGINNYEGTASGTFTINKVTPAVTAPTPLTSLVYNGKAQALINNGSTNYGTLQYSLDNSTYSASIPSGTNATAYTVYYRVVGDSNINDVAAQSVSVSISKVTPTVVAPTPKVLTYNGSSQELANSGSTDFGTLKYKVGSDSWSTSVPTRTRSGSYELYYKVDGDSNVYDVPSASTTCSINEKQVTATVTLSQTTYTYNGSACQPTPTVKDGTTVIDPSEYTVTYSNNVNAGTATVTISDNVGGDYEVIGSATFTINKAAGSVTTVPVNNDYTYNGASRAAASAGSGTGTMYYRLGTSGSFSTTMPTMTNAGSNTLYYYAAASTNYEQSSTGSIVVSVQKANISPTVSISNWTYDNSASNPSVTGNSGGGAVTYYYKSTSSSSWSTTKPSNAGNYNIRADIAATTNYNSGTCTNSFTINKANPTYTAPTAKSLTYNGSAQSLLNAGSTNHGTIQYSSDGSNWSTTIPSQTNANTYTTYWKLIGDANHNDVSSTSISTTIAKAPACGIAPTAKSLTYTGSGQALVNAGSSSCGTMQYATASTATYSTTIPTQTNAGTYTTYWKVANDSNHSGTSSGSVSTTIAKASQSAPTATGATTTYNTTATATASGGGGQGSLEWESTQSQTSVGSHSTRARWSGNSNYNASPWSNSVTVQMNKANQSAPTATGATVYESSTATATASGGGGQGSLEWSNGSTRTAVGSQTTKARWSGNDNYNASSWSNEVTLEVIEAVKVVAKFNVTSTSSPTRIANDTSNFSAIEIDGVFQTAITSAYTFNTTGEHIVKYILKDQTSISMRAFANCSSLTSIDIPSGVTSIGNNAFANCTSLPSIDIPDSVTSIGNSVFQYCSSLTSVTIPSGVTSIDNWTFYNCTSLTSINIPNSVTSIGGSAFGYCTSLTSINIPNSVTSIGSYAFQDCSSLTSITIPSGVTSIGYAAFYNCSGLTSVNIPNGVTSIGDSTFANCSSLTSITIPSGVTTIGNRAFFSCSGLTSVIIPNSVTTIGDYAFRDCTSLTSITIPNGVTSIGQSAFQGCYSLTSINIPSGVTSIGDDAFFNCRNLTSITSNAPTAPTISSSTFLAVKKGGTLTVPRGSTGYDVWMGRGGYYLGYYGWTKVEQ